MVKKQAIEVAVVENNLPVILHQAHVGLGDEGVGSQDMQLPMLFLAQSLSAIVKDRDSGARDGDFYNSVTGEIYGDSLRIVPIMFKVEYVVWKKNATTGAFRGSFPTQEDAARRIVDLADEEPGFEWIITRTPVHLIGILDGNGYLTPAAFPMSRSFEPKSRQWNSQIQFLRPKAARFARSWLVTTEEKTNVKGAWFVPKFSRPEALTEMQYAEAFELYEAMRNANSVTYEHEVAGETVTDDDDI
jgi:hypothetical protein